MSQTLSIKNYSKLNRVETTKLSGDANVGDVSLSVYNSQNFAANSHILIGSYSSDQSEKVIASSVPNSTTIGLSANLQRTHNKFDTVTRLFGNKIKVYRAANVDGSQPADGSFSLLATIDIDFDQTDTEYTDVNGSKEYWYKTTFYDSVADIETALNESASYRGGNFGVYASVDSIRRAAGLQNNTHISDALIEEKRQAAQALINSTLTVRYVLPLATDPVNPLVAEMTRLLAAGYLLTQELGTTVSGRLYAEGQAMIDRVTNAQKTGLLDRVDSGSLSLLNEKLVSVESPSGGSFKAWPNASTATAPVTSGGSPRYFRSGMQY